MTKKNLFKKLFRKNPGGIEDVYRRALPLDYLELLKSKTNQWEVRVEGNATANFDCTNWGLMSEIDLLKSWEMNGVGNARNFERLKLYIKVQKEFSFDNTTSSNIGVIDLDRVAEGFVFAESNGDYLYFDASDSNSVWVYFHDGGDVEKIADSFSELLLTKAITT